MEAAYCIEEQIIQEGDYGGQKNVIENFDHLQSLKKTSFMRYPSVQTKNQKNIGSKLEEILLDSNSKDESISVNSGGQKMVIENFDTLQSVKKGGIMKYPSFQMKNQKNIVSKEKIFLDIIPLLDSNSEDDFMSVNDGQMTTKDTEEGDKEESYLDMFQNSYDFYCPNCCSCISRQVINFARELKSSSLIQAQGLPSTEEATEKFILELISHNFHCCRCNVCIKTLLIRRRRTRKLESWLDTDRDKGSSMEFTREPEELPRIYSCLGFFTLFIAKSSNPSQESKKLLAHDDQASGTVMELALKQNSIAKLWELILPCIVNGGLFESISTLIIVTCASTANIPNGNILALALTNMITGLCIIRHNLPQVLRKHKQKMGPSGIKVEQPNQLKKVLKDVLQYLLPFTITILSFLFFGMVPPLVYVFTFRDTDDKHFKLATMVGASVLCTTLLAFLKAHLQKPKNWVFYGKTVVCFVFIGVLAFVLSYLAGDLFGKLILKFDYLFV